MLSTKLDLEKIKAVLIDLDGTLVDTVGDFTAALNAMLSDMPPPYSLAQVDEGQVRRWVGKGSEYLIQSVLHSIDKEAGLSSETLLRSAFSQYQLHYKIVNGKHAAIYPGVIHALDHFRHRGWAMVCVTNKPTEFAIDLLSDKALLSHFNFVLGGDAFIYKKPHPMPLLKACEKLGTLPKHTLMIGDSSNDAMAARAAKCPVLLMTFGYNHGEPNRAVDADGFVDDWVDFSGAAF